MKLLKSFEKYSEKYTEQYYIYDLINSINKKYNADLQLNKIDGRTKYSKLYKQLLIYNGIIKIRDFYRLQIKFNIKTKKTIIIISNSTSTYNKRMIVTENYNINDIFDFFNNFETFVLKSEKIKQFNI